MESSISMDASVASCNGGLVQHFDTVDVNGEVGFLEEFNSYLDDIEDRLTVSRMVNDSVIKGMVSALEQEAAEKFVQKDSELEMLKETLRLYQVGSNGKESMKYSMKYLKPKSRISEFLSISSNGIADHDELPDSLADLKLLAKEQFQQLKKELGKIKGSTSIRRKGSASKMLGLSGILGENMPDKWIDVDKALDDLKTTLESICTQSEEMVCMPKSMLFDWQREREFQAEIEGMVIKSCIQSLQEDFEQRLWDQSTRSYANESANWLEKIKDISSLRQQLDAISQSLSVPENGHLLSHGSLEHRMASGDHVGSLPLREENGKHDESIIVVPESLEHAQLKHLSKEELFNYLKAEMTKMKRHHELTLQEETEKYYSLRREYLNERGSSLTVRKYKELDSLRRKIPDFISQLDNILAENQKLPSSSNNDDGLDSLNNRLETLRLENRQLKDLLVDKKKEIKCLHSQVFDASQKILKCSLAEETSLRMLKNLKQTMKDAQIESSISEDLYKFLVGEVLKQMEGISEEVCMEYDIVLGIYENIFKEVSDNAATVNKIEIEDSIIESIIMQGLCENVYRDSLKEVKEKVITWNQKFIDETEVRMSLELEALEKEKSLRFNIAEREKLELGTVVLSDIVSHKNKPLQEAAEALAKEEEKFKLASLELEKLRDQSAEQDKLISKYDEELKVVKSDLVKALENVEINKGHITGLNEQLETVMQNLREAVQEKNMLHSISQEHQKRLSLVQAREREHVKQMNSTIIFAQGLSEALTNFGCKATENIKSNSMRLGSLSSQFSSLIQQASRLRRTKSQYKRRLEKQCSDFQKAEAEVDLLGDEVDALLSLLEKIYIALDHYSPILQHYHGIMEVLMLVRRELSGEAVKSV